MRTESRLRSNIRIKKLVLLGAFTLFCTSLSWASRGERDASPLIMPYNIRHEAPLENQEEENHEKAVQILRA